MATDNLETGLAPEDGKWEFDGEVAASFDDMLERSIPQYEIMRQLTTDVAAWHHDRAVFGGRPTPTIVDMGASRGAALAPLVDKIGVRARFLACDVSEPMLEACRERFAGMMNAGVVRVVNHDLRDGFPSGAGPVAVALSILTLQFVPIEYRQTLLRQTCEALLPGGALVLVEKVLGEADETNRLLVDLYYGMKREHGYTQEAIDRKRLALEGVLVPLTASFNEEMLRRAGFDLVEQFWGYCNFRGWVAVKR